MRVLAGAVLGAIFAFASPGLWAQECWRVACDSNTTLTVIGGVSPSVAVASTAITESRNAGTAASGWVTSCVGEVVSGEQALALLSGRAVPFDQTDLSPRFDPTASWGLVRCPAHPNAGVAGDLYAIYEVAAPPQRVIDLVVARAYGATVLPELVVSSLPSGSLDHPLVTGLGSWLWLAGWGTASASASLPGITATVTASPDTAVSWRLVVAGRVDDIECSGPGNATSASCELTPTIRGDGLLGARVRWEYSVVCTPFCAVALPDAVAESATPVVVAEVRGVIVG